MLFPSLDVFLYAKIQNSPLFNSGYIANQKSCNVIG